MTKQKVYIVRTETIQNNQLIIVKLYQLLFWSHA